MDRADVALYAAKVGALTGGLTAILAAMASGAVSLLNPDFDAFPGIPRLWVQLVMVLVPALALWIGRRRFGSSFPIPGFLECVYLIVGLLLALLVVPLWGMAPPAWREVLSDLGLLGGTLLFAILVGALVGGAVGFAYGLVLGRAAKQLWLAGFLFGGFSVWVFATWLDALATEVFGPPSRSTPWTLVYAYVGALAGGMAAAAVRKRLLAEVERPPLPLGE